MPDPTFGMIYFVPLAVLGRKWWCSQSSCCVLFLSNKVTYSAVSKYSCMRILDTVRHFYLFSIFTNILNTFFLTHTKSTPITDIDCINHTVSSLLVHSNIIWSTFRTCFTFLSSKVIRDSGNWITCEQH